MDFTLLINMMTSIEIILLMSLAITVTNAATCTDYIQINKKYYKQEKQYNITGIPSDMSIDFKTGDIYYTLISKDAKMKLQRIKNDNIEDIVVNGVGQSTTIDNINQKVYLATSKGVYVFHEDKEPVLLIGDEDVMYVAVANDGESLFIATYPQNRVQKYSKGNMERFEAIPNGRGLKIDGSNNIYFVADQTPYVLRNDGLTYANYSTKIKGLPENKALRYGFAVSRNNEVYLLDHGGRVYLLVGEDNSMYLGRFLVKDVNTFAFDSDENIFIGGVEAIIKFKCFKTCPR